MPLFTLRRRHPGTDPQLPATASNRSGAPTQHELLAALAGLGISALSRAIAHGEPGSGLVTTPITRDGDGWGVGIDLPYGVTATDVIIRRAKLAAGLRRPVGAVWPTPRHDIHPGRLQLWIAERPIHQMRQSTWPLATAATADVFAPIPIGTDERGRLVEVTLGGHHVLVAGHPRSGVGNTVRLLGRAAALDPTAELRLFDPRGTGDFTSLGLRARSHLAGCDEQELAAMLVELRNIRQLMQQRFATLRTLSSTVPASPVTRDQAGPDTGLHPVVVLIDEVQELLAHAAVGTETADIVTDLLRRGAAVNMTVVAGVGNADQSRIPTAFWQHFPIRICHRVHSSVTNDRVLGTGAYANGVRATDLTSRDKGVAILARDGQDPVTVRTFWTDPA